MSPTNAPIHATSRLRRTCRVSSLTAWGLATLTAFTTLGGGTGCTTWSAGPVPRGSVARAVAYHRPVRLRFANGNTAVIAHARVVGDSIVGAADDAPDPAPRFAVALSDVRGLEEEHVSGFRTAALVLVPLIAVAIYLGTAVSNMKYSLGLNGR